MELRDPIRFVTLKATPEAMNHYDELGLTAHATPEEIKDAYRALMRLLHPDHQQDPQLQKVAERQVQKLNKAYATISDPDRRRLYDRELAEGAERAKPIIIHAPPPPARGFVNKSSIAWMTAVGVFLALLIWMASRPVQTNPAYSSGANIVETPIRPEPVQPVVIPPPVVVPTSKPTFVEATNRSNAEADALRLKLVQALSERDAALAEVSRLESRVALDNKALERASQRAPATIQVARAVESKHPNPLSAETRTEPRQPQPPAPLTTARVIAPPPPPDIPMVFRHPMTGSWVYRKPAEAPKNKDLFPPEFIETTITEENGQLRGTYRARYHVPNRPVSPDVNFQFAGHVNGESGSLPWNGAGGSKGEVTFKLMADHSLRVDWTASQLGTLGFYRGTAVLVKRVD